MGNFLKNIGIFIIFILIFALSQLVVGFVVVGVITGGQLNDTAFMLTYFFSMLLCYLLATTLERVTCKSVQPINNARGGFNPTTILMGVVLLVAMSVVLSPLGELLPAVQRSFPNGPCTLITVVVLAPIFEEVIFRGRLYNILHRRSSPMMSASMSALAFGIVHFEPMVVVEALLAGVIFSYFYIRKRSIITPIILHMCNNSLAYALIVLSYGGVPLSELTGDERVMQIAYGVSVVVLIVGMFVVLRGFALERRRERRVEESEIIYTSSDDESLAEEELNGNTTDN